MTEMGLPGQFRAAFVRLVSVAALLAITLRALVPAGYMLANADARDHGVTVALCTEQGGGVSSPDPAGGKTSHGKPSDGDRSPDAPCTFAVLAHLAPAPNDVAFPVASGRETEASFLPLAQRPALSPTGPPLPARGPPVVI